jgi:secondary thiamine-phosphate synthase enzyme
MKFLTEYVTFNTRNIYELVNITDLCWKFLERSGITEGMIMISAMHITAGVFINDNEPGLHQDIKDWLQKLAPKGPDYLHHRTGEVNGDAHLKSLLIGHQVIIPVTDGKLDFGPWQEVFYAEFDGRRPKRVLFKAMGE